MMCLIKFSRLIKVSRLIKFTPHQGPRGRQGGVDAGDHPPITPVAAATEEELGGGDTWRLYDHVARHFLGSISAPAVSRR